MRHTIDEEILRMFRMLTAEQKKSANKKSIGR